MVETTPDKLSQDLQKIVSDYLNQSVNRVDVVLKQVGNKGRNAVRREARAQIVPSRRKYANGWQYKMVGNRWASEVIIYAGKQPGMTHLLEHGHALRSGGRSVGNTNARPHILPVQEKIEREIIGDIMRVL